jgi:hypothetical protein
MLKKKKFNGYKPDSDGYIIGDKIKLNPIYDKKNRTFTIFRRKSPSYDGGNHSYALLDESGSVPRIPISPRDDGYEYFNADHLTKIK